MAMQIESSRNSRAREAAADHVSREILPKQVETERAKAEKRVDNATTTYVKVKVLEKSIERQGGPVLKPEKNRSGRKAASEKSAAAKSKNAEPAPGQTAGDAAKSDAFDTFKDVVGKLTEGAKLTKGLINELKDVGLALKDLVSSLKGGSKPAPAPPALVAAPAPAAPALVAPPSAGVPAAIAPSTAAASAAAAPSIAAAAPAAQAVPAGADAAPEDPAEALRRLRETFDKLLAQVQDLLGQLRALLNPAALGKKDATKCWCAVSNGLGYPLTAGGEIADPESFKLWAAALPPAPPTVPALPSAPQVPPSTPPTQSAPQVPPSTTPAPSAPQAPPSTPPAAPSPEPGVQLKLDNPYRVTLEEGKHNVYINTGENPHAAPKSEWGADVQEAIARAQNKGLGLDPKDHNKIINWDNWHQGVTLEMRAMGYKAFFDGEELQVTQPGSDHSEHFKISTSWRATRYFYKSHVAPAAFE